MSDGKEKGTGESLSNITTADDQLSKLRAGNNQDLTIKYNDFKIKVRLMPALEFATVVAQSKAEVKAPIIEARVGFESLAMMIGILSAATTINNSPQLANGFLDKLTASELECLFDSYIDIIQKVDPEFEAMPLERVAALIEEAKKKALPSSNFTTCQHAAIGAYFLDEILPAVKEAGL